MALFQLPYPSSENETMQVTLDGVSYRLTWLWNARDSHWFLSLALLDGTSVASGMRVVISWDLLQHIGHLRAPPGEIYFFDQSVDSSSIAGDDPRQDDLGKRVQGYYVSVST